MEETMSEEESGLIDRRTAVKAMGVSGLLGVSGVLNVSGHQPQSQDQQNGERDCVPGVYIPLIDAYYNGEKIWFIHTSASSQQMATRLEKMINYTVLHVPKLDDIADIDELGNIYVFKNGVKRTEAEPWGGGPFGYQIDILDSVPGNDAYTPLRNPHVVTWNEDADPEILKSVEQLMAAKEAGRLSIKQTDVVVNAPVVKWPDGAFENIMGIDESDMPGKCPMGQMMTESETSRNQTQTMTENNSSSVDTEFP